MSIGEKIKKLRELRNYTQEHMASQLGLSQAGYSKIERNESDLSFSKLKQIAEILETTPEDIISFDDKYLFNNIHNNKQVGVFNSTQLSEREHKLYEKQIKLLEDQVAHLKLMLETLIEKQK